MHIVHAECFGAGYQAFSDVIAAAEESQPNAKPAMLIEQDTGFELMISANQHRRALSVFQGVRRDEVLRVRGEIIFLAAAPAANRSPARCIWPALDSANPN